MNITIGGKPLGYSKYYPIYLNLLKQPTADLINPDEGWIHIEKITKEEAKKIYEAVYNRVRRNCTHERLQSSKIRNGDGYTLSLRRVAVIQ